MFVCNVPDSGRHVTRPNQGLSTGRRENLGTRLVDTLVGWPTLLFVSNFLVKSSGSLLILHGPLIVTKSTHVLRFYKL